MVEQLAILWEPEALTISDGRAAWRVPKPEIESGASTLAADWGRAARSTLDERGVALKKAIVVVPREMIVVRSIEVPEVPDHELAEIVRIQAASRAALPPEAISLDYLTLPNPAGEPGIRVLAFTIDAARLIECREWLTTAGLDWTAFTVSSMAAAEAVAQSPDVEVRQPALIVHVRRNAAEFTVVNHDQVVFSQSARLTGDFGPALERELTRVSMGLTQSLPGNEIAQAVLIAEDCDSAPLMTVLEHRYRRHVTQLGAAKRLSGPSDAGKSAGTGIASATPGSDVAGHVASVPFALSGAWRMFESPRLPTIDLVHPRQPKPPGTALPLRAIGVAAGLVLLLGLGWWWHSSTMAQLETDIASTRDRVRELDALLQRGQPKFDADHAIGRWTSAVPELSLGWSAFQSLLPATDRVYFTSVRTAPGEGDGRWRLGATGAAKSRREIGDLERRLAESGFRVRPQAPTVNRKDPDYPFSFELDMDWLGPPSTPATPDRS